MESEAPTVDSIGTIQHPRGKWDEMGQSCSENRSVSNPTLLNKMLDAKE